MRIIEISALDNGAHRNQTINGAIKNVPDGWAVIPDDMAIPDTFPFVNITTDGLLVTSMTAGVVPDPDPEPVPDPEPTEIELAQQAITDLELNDIEQGQAITDLELQLLEVQAK